LVTKHFEAGLAPLGKSHLNFCSLEAFVHLDERSLLAL